MTPHIQGGQGRSAADIEGGGYVMAFTFAVALCIVVLLVVSQCVKGAS